MAADTPQHAAGAEERPTCPACGHLNIPGAAFCARCGRSLDEDATNGDGTAVAGDSQATSAFEPVASTVTPPPSSPWARPGAIDDDPGLTTELPAPEFEPVTPYRPAYDAAGSQRVRGPQGVRGFWLGALAVLVILAVLAVYLYAAWLSDSARSTIDGWLPWK